MSRKYSAMAARKWIESIQAKREILKPKPALAQFKTSTVQGLSDYSNAKYGIYKCLWLTAFILASIACFLHLYYLIETFLIEPNGTSIEYQYQSEIKFPVVHICPVTSKFLNPLKLPKDYRNDILQMEMGMGIVNEYNSHNEYLFDVNITQLRNTQYSIESYKQFLANYSLTCSELFFQCKIGHSKKVDCCEIFQPIYTLQGPCFAARELWSKRFGALGRVNVLLNPHRATFTGRSNATPPYVSHKIILSEGLEQNMQQDFLYLRPNEIISYNVRKQIRIQLPSSGRCVENPELQYFTDYTESNCIWEKLFLQKLPLLNLTCDLPITNLLKSQTKSNNLCSIEEITKLYDYQEKGEEKTVASKTFVDRLQTIYHIDLAALGLPCQLPTIENPTNPCTTQDIFAALGIDVSSLTKPQNTAPSMWSVLDKLESLSEISNTNPCPMACVADHFVINQNKERAPELLGDASQIILTFETNEVEVIEETLRQSLSEYIAIIGGNLGLWTGASLLSLGHLLVLIFKACLLNKSCFWFHEDPEDEHTTAEHLERRPRMKRSISESQLDQPADRGQLVRFLSQFDEKK